MTDAEWLELLAEMWFCVFLHPSKKMGQRRRIRAMKSLQEQHPDIHQALWSLVGKKLDAVLDSLPKHGTLKELVDAGGPLGDGDYYPSREKIMRNNPAV